MSTPATSLMPRRLWLILRPVALLCCATFVTSLLPWLTGREPALSLLRALESERVADEATLENLRAAYDVPSSPWESIVGWLRGGIVGDFGNSWLQPGSSALSVAARGLPITAVLTATSLFIALLAAILMVAPRAWSARARGGHATTIWFAILASLPNFVLAIGVLWLGALQLTLFPVGGWASPAHMVLPVLSMAIPAAGVFGRLLFIALDSTLAEPWVRTWSAARVPQRVLFRAVIRRAFPPSIPVLALFLAGTLSSTAAVETTFSIPGFGTAVVEAAQKQDIPVIQAAVFIVVVIGVVTGLLARLAELGSHHGLTGADAGVADSAGRGGTIRLRWALVAAFPLLVAVVGAFRTVAITPSDRLLSPSIAHPLGTDQLGRDVWARLGDGTLHSLGLALALTAVCFFLGVLGAHAGGGIRQVGDVLNALPEVLIGLILAGVCGASTWTAAIAVISVGWIPLAAHGSVVAAEARTTAHYRFAALMGARRLHLLRYHVLPHTVPAIARHAVSRVAHVAVNLAALGYLGVGAAPGSSEWGVILNESIRYLDRAPLMALGPTLALISFGVLAVIVTDRLFARDSYRAQRG